MCIHRTAYLRKTYEMAHNETALMRGILRYANKMLKSFGYSARKSVHHTKKRTVMKRICTIRHQATSQCWGFHLFISQILNLRLSAKTYTQST